MFLFCSILYAVIYLRTRRYTYSFAVWINLKNQPTSVHVFVYIFYSAALVFLFGCIHLYPKRNKTKIAREKTVTYLLDSKGKIPKYIYTLRVIIFHFSVFRDRVFICFHLKLFNREKKNVHMVVILKKTLRVILKDENCRMQGRTRK